jgi:Domain of unknown function (DUF4282)
MAGQPPEPSFQPANQDQGLTQGRPAWQPGAYNPPAGNGGQQAYSAPNYGSQEQAYAAPPPPGQGGYPPQDQGGYGSQEQGYAAQNQGYPPQDPTYVAGAPGTSQDYQGYQGYQPPSYGAQGAPDQGQGAAGTPQWQQGLAGMKPATQRKQKGEKGFIGSLLDFSFTSLGTPKIIKVLYVLLTIWTALVAIFFLIIGFRTGGIAGGLFTLIIVEPIFILLTLGIWRVVLEAFMVVFRVYEETKKIAENTGTRD